MLPEQPAEPQSAELHSDERYMARAFELARRGRFTTTPNPNVGCVIVLNGEIVGEGYHLRAGEPHAEVHALRMAGDKAKGATAYVTLEPCSHHGRTPPCADALLAAGITRVVAAMQDPNPEVAGRGLYRLKQNGVDVSHGLMHPQAEAVNLGFLKRMRTGFPTCSLKWARLWMAGRRWPLAKVSGSPRRLPVRMFSVFVPKARRYSAPVPPCWRIILH